MKGHAWEGRWRPAGWLKQESTVRRSKGEAKSTPAGREQGLLSPDSPLLLHSNSCVFVLVVMGTELRASYSVHYGREDNSGLGKFFQVKILHKVALTFNIHSECLLP